MSLKRGGRSRQYSKSASFDLESDILLLNHPFLTQVSKNIDNGQLTVNITFGVVGLIV